MRPFPILITPTTEAVSILLDTTTTLSTVPKERRGGVQPCLSAIGTLVAANGEEILIQKPIVADPSVSNDAHWSQLSINDTDLKLREGHDAEPIPVALIVRIKKPATASAVGVGWI